MASQSNYPENTPGGPPRDDGAWGGWWVWLIILIAVIGVWWGWGWWGGGRGNYAQNSAGTNNSAPANNMGAAGNTGAAQGTSSGTNANTGGNTVSVNGVADGAFNGKVVTVEGEVSRILGPNEFLLRNVGQRPAGPEVLVLATTALPVKPGRAGDERVIPGDVLRVMGPVRPFNAQQFSHDYNLKLPGTTFNEWTGRPAIAATEITFAGANVGE